MTRTSRSLRTLLATVLSLAFLTACPLPGDRPPLPEGSIPMEYSYPDRDQSQSWVNGERRAWESSNNFTINDVDDRWLYYKEVKQVGETYVATGLSVGQLGESSFFKDGSMLLEPCEGTVTLAKDEWQFDVSGSKDCDAFSGTFRPSGKKKVGPKDPACERYTACVCGLQREWPKVHGEADNPFIKICKESRDLLVAAKDDPDACKTGLGMIGGMAKERGVTAAECK